MLGLLESGKRERRGRRHDVMPRRDATHKKNRTDRASCPGPGDRDRDRDRSCPQSSHERGSEARGG